MDAIAAACADMLRTNIADLRATIAGMSDEGINWTPAPETNSIAVLVAHAVSATRALIDAALVGEMDRPRYLAEERTPAFNTRDATASGLLTLVDGLGATADRVQGGATVDYAGTITIHGDPSAPVRTRAWNLIHAIEHLREHIGHAQVTRQLWEACG